MKFITLLIVAITTTTQTIISAKRSNGNPTNVHQMITRKQQNEHKTISRLLDKLLENYDNSLRPNFGGLPAVIEIDLNVRSMGPISEVEMTYSMDCYFRQSWVDRRLAFEDSSSNVSTLALSISMLNKIWKPDTYFLNGKASYLHTITTPNKFVRLYQNGRVLYSSRLTIKAACPMNLVNFPMDVQICPLRLGSFGYTANDVVYRWNNRAVAISDDLRMSQFDLIDVPSSNESYTVENDKGGKVIVTQEFSVLMVSFHLQRHMGNFLIQVYGPCVLLVVLSWVSFFLNREATADRVSLGITTVLTMTFLGLEARTDLPKVSYPTALDFFVFLSFAFIFATILQYAFVHYFTKYGSGECYYDFWDDSDDSDTDENFSRISSLTQIDSADAYGVIPLSRLEIKITQERSTARLWRSFKSFFMKNILCYATKDMQNYDEDNFGNSQQIVDLTLSRCEPSSSGASTNTLNTPQTRKSSISTGRRIINRDRRNLRRNFNSVSKIDKFSRVAFPFLFFFINVIYWIFYLSRSQRK